MTKEPKTEAEAQSMCLDVMRDSVLEEEKLLAVLEEQPDSYTDWISRLKKMIHSHKSLIEALKTPRTTYGNIKVGIDKMVREWNEGLSKEVNDFIDKLREDKNLKKEGDYKLKND